MSDLDYVGYQEEIRELKKKVKTLEDHVVSGFHEDGTPSYSQGLPVCELQEILTANEANILVGRICDLSLKLESAREALKEIKEHPHLSYPEALKVEYTQNNASGHTKGHRCCAAIAERGLKQSK
jgi:hypothetical protein